jgi:hypothetical protein
LIHRLVRLGALLMLTLLATVLRWHAYGQTPYANGWDAYFYLVQVQSWMAEGRMHSPDASLIYPFFRLVYWFTGDYVVMYQLGAALLAGMVTGAVVLVGFWDGRPSWSPPTWALPGAISLASPHLTYFCAQYPKNALGWVFFLLLYAALQRQFSHKWVRWGVLAGLLALNYVGHRLTFGLGVLLVMGVLFLESPRRVTWTMVAWIALTGGLVVGLGAVLPGVLHVTDWSRLGRVWPDTVQLAPVSFVYTFGVERLSAGWCVEIVLSLIAWLILMFRFRYLNSAEKTLWLMGLLLMWPFQEWSLTGMAYRFYMLFVLFLPLYTSIILRAAKNNAWLWILLLTLVLISPWTQQGYDPEKHDPQYRVYDRVSQKVMAYFSKENIRPELIIAHNALAEYVTFTNGVDAMPWLPEYPIDADKLWRIAVPDERLLPDSSHAIPLNGRYVLLREADWQSWLRQRALEGDTLQRTWKNPDQIRPAFLLQKKRAVYPTR